MESKERVRHVSVESVQKDRERERDRVRERENRVTCGFFESECFHVPHATCTAVRECQGEAVGK